MKRGDTDALWAFLDDTGGMGTFTAKVLATTTFVCQTTMRVPPALRDFLNYYRIAAVHDRDRLARKVRTLRGPWWRRKATLTEAVVAVIALDYTYLYGAKTGIGLANTMLTAMQNVHVSRSIDHGNAVAADALARYARARRVTVATNPSKRTVDALADDFARPIEPTVRVGDYTGPINLAVAEFTVQTCPDTVLGRGHDINLDMAVADYYNRGGDFTLTYPDTAAYSTAEGALVDAVRRELGVGDVVLTIPSDVALADAAGADNMWLTTHAMIGERGTNIGDFTDDALLTESGVHYLLHRVRTWTANLRG